MLGLGLGLGSGLGLGLGLGLGVWPCATSSTRQLGLWCRTRITRKRGCWPMDVFAKDESASPSANRLNSPAHVGMGRPHERMGLQPGQRRVAGCRLRGGAGLAVDELTQPRRDGGEVLGDLGWG